MTGACRECFNPVAGILLDETISVILGLVTTLAGFNPVAGILLDETLEKQSEIGLKKEVSIPLPGFC